MNAKRSAFMDACNVALCTNVPYAAHIISAKMVGVITNCNTNVDTIACTSARIVKIVALVQIPILIIQERADMDVLVIHHVSMAVHIIVRNLAVNCEI